jgi:putative superfamily III holin-X
LAVDSTKQQVLQPDRNGDQATFAAAVMEVTDKVSLIVREEIELAKAEMTQKVTKLVKGAVVGAAAGIFAVVGLLFLLHGFAWLTWWLLPGQNNFFWGFFIVAFALFALGGIAGFLAYRFVRSGGVPVPEMAIDEAKRIRATVQSSTPTKTI